MSEQQYNILFRGDIVLGFQLSDVKLRLQQLFKADETKINSLFTGRPVVLKRNLDLAAAEKYRKALLQAGAQIEVVADNNCPAPMSPAVDKAVKSAGAAPTVREAAPHKDLSQSSGIPIDNSAHSDSSTQDWGLSPLGANLLKSTERRPFVARDIDTSALQVCAPGDHLVDADARPSIGNGVRSAPDFGLAKAGENLLAGYEKAALVNSELAIADWQIAEVGADLIAEDEREIIIPPLINSLDADIAPVGTDLGQIKSKPKPLPPDISRIHLVE